jgi:hypothetical protein
MLRICRVYTKGKKMEMINDYFYWKGFIHGALIMLLIWTAIDFYTKNEKKNKRKIEITERKEPTL